MRKKNKNLITILLIIVGTVLVLTSLWSTYLAYKNIIENKFANNVENVLEENNNTEDNIIKENKFAEPIAEFEKRITKKPFGIYIEPASSPVQPEKFKGYHTGVDVEYEDIKDEVDVLSIANGKVILSRWVSGYGGVVAIRHNIENENVISLYGHLDPESLMSIDSEVNRGDIIGILGEGGTSETDYERKHLHLGIIKGSEINLKGYVGSEGELGGWYDPVEFLK